MHRRKHNKDKTIGRAHSSSITVSNVDYYLLNLSVSPPSPALSTVTLTPGRLRNIDQDMEALRVSRQDNPFIQKVIASRETLTDSLEEESDHTNLMSRELSLDLDVDPLTLPEVHEHMIRSPPPTMWEQSPNYKVFHFPNGEDELLQVEINDKQKVEPDFESKNTSSDLSDSCSLRSEPKSHYLQTDRFSLAPNSSKSPAEDSIRLMNED